MMKSRFVGICRSVTERVGPISHTKRTVVSVDGVFIVAALALFVLAFVLGVSLPCDHEFWGGIKVGLGAVCR